VFERALAWFDTRPAAELAGDSSRTERLRTLYSARRWDAARSLVAELVREHPESVSYQGIRGALAARRGDREEAARADSSLIEVWSRTRQGVSTYWRACIAAQLGDSSGAVRLLWRAHDEGEGVHPEFFMMLHTDPSLEPLRAYPPFQAFLRPKG
jgi:predicted Zn-dependent protease